MGPSHIITKIHVAFNHTGFRKVHDYICEKYYGITANNVAWVSKHCGHCCFNAPDKTTPIFQPIVSTRCLDRIQINLDLYKNLKRR